MIDLTFLNMPLVDLGIYLGKAIILPIAVYLWLRFVYSRVAHLSVIQKIHVSLNLAFILTCLMLAFRLAHQSQLMFLAKINELLLYLTLFYIAIKALEIIFIEEALGARRQINIPVFVRDIIRFLLLILAITLLLKIVFGIEASTFLVTSTVISAVIGLALQDMLSNIIAGIALQVERPFKVGDWVQINGREGKIHEMSWRTTKIQTRENDFIIIPNASVAQQEISNFFVPSRLHVLQMYIGTSYHNPPNQVKASILKIIQDTPHILKKPNPQVFLINYNDFSIDYEIRVWIKDYELLPAIKDEVMTKIWYQFKRDKIEIPFPIRTIHLTHHETQKEEDNQAYHRLLDEIVESIHDIDILQPFSRDKLYELAKLVRHQIFTKDEYLVRQGDVDSSFYIIKSGKVEVLVQKPDRTETSIGTFGEDYYFGEIALLTGEPRTASVIAREDTEVLIIDKDSFGLMLKENPQMAKQLSELLQNRLRETKSVQMTDNWIMSPEKKRPADETDAQNLLSRIQRFFRL